MAGRQLFKRYAIHSSVNPLTHQVLIEQFTHNAYVAYSVKDPRNLFSAEHSMNMFCVFLSTKHSLSFTQFQLLIIEPIVGCETYHGMCLTKSTV